MDSQMLIREMAVPVSAERHGDWSLESANNFGCCSIANSVPLMTVEFFNAASEYAIVFGDTEAGVMPSVVLGVHRDENLYLSESGAWRATYIPAFVRRYPFVYCLSEDGVDFTLCVDESFPYFNIEDRGKRLFAADKKPTAYVAQMLRLLEQYRFEFQRTQSFCSKLVEFDLLEPLHIDPCPGELESLSSDGMMVVSREKAKSMTPNQISHFARSDEFGLLQLHFQSMRNLSFALGRRLESPAASGKRVPGAFADRLVARI